MASEETMAEDDSDLDTEENTESPSKKQSMDVDEDEDEDDDLDDNSDEETQESEPDKDKEKENKKPKNGKKRANQDPKTTQPRKKQKTDHHPKKLKIKIGKNGVDFEVKKLQKLPYFKDKIDKKTFKFKKNNYGTFSSNTQKFNMEDFERMMKYIENKDILNDIDDVMALQGFIYCSDKFKIKPDSKEIEECYKNCSDYNEFDIENWETARPQLLKDLYKIKNEEEKEDEEEEEDQEEEEDEEKKNKKQTKKPKNKRTPRRTKKREKKDIVPSGSNDEYDVNDEEEDIEKDEDEEDEDGDIKIKTKRISKQLKKIPKYWLLSDDENNNKKNNEDEEENKSKRLQHRKKAIFTQEPPKDDLITSSESEEEDDEIKKQRKLNNLEKHIKRVEDIDSDQKIESLQPATIRRLCTRHNIQIHKKLTRKEKEEKKKWEENNKDRKKGGWKHPFIDNKKLIEELQELREKMDDELSIRRLSDINDVRDIGDLQRKTIVRLCKEERLPANKKVNDMIKALEKRYKNPVVDPHIKTLKDVKVDDIEHLEREVLVRLCNAHNISTTKKKRKKKNDDDDEEEEEDEDDPEIDLVDDKLIEALENIKKSMNETKKQRQDGKIKKLEAIQENIVNIGFPENYLTISGSHNIASSNSNKSRRRGIGRKDRNHNRKKKDNIYESGFKSDIKGLVALCNSIVTQNGYSVVDDPLDQYQVVVSETGARTIKVMMVIARGGSVVPEKWVNHSIKNQQWQPPTNYEDKWPNWQQAADASRDSRIGSKNSPLLSEYSIYVQPRIDLTPSTTIIEHLAHAAGAQIVNAEWKTKRLSKKTKEEKENESEDEDEVEEEEEIRGRKKGGKKRLDDDDSDGKKKKKKKKKKSEKEKKVRIKASRSRKKGIEENEDDENDEDDNYENEEDETKKKKDKKKKKEKEKIERIKLIISHPAICRNLPFDENEYDYMVKADWLYDSIENYEVVDMEDKKYIVKPNKQSTTSPIH